MQADLPALGPTSAVAESLGHDVGLVATGVEPQGTLVVVGLAVAAADRDGRSVGRTVLRADAVGTADASVAGLGALAARVALELVAVGRDR